MVKVAGAAFMIATALLLLSSLPLQAAYDVADGFTQTSVVPANFADATALSVAAAPGRATVASTGAALSTVFFDGTPSSSTPLPVTSPSQVVTSVRYSPAGILHLLLHTEDAPGRVLAADAGGWAPHVTFATDQRSPRAFAFDSGGAMLVTGAASPGTAGWLVRHDAGGTPVFSVATPPWPVGVAFDSRDAGYLATADGKVYVLSASGALYLVAALPGEWVGPSIGYVESFTIGWDDAFYFGLELHQSSGGYHSAVLKLERPDHLYVIVRGADYAPVDLTFAPDRALLVAGEGAGGENRVLRVAGPFDALGVQQNDPTRVLNASIPGSLLVFPKFVTGTVNVGTAARPVAAPRSSFEVSVTCPRDVAACAVGTRVKLAGHWVCPGSQAGDQKFICQEVDFTLDTTVKGTLWFSPEPGDTAALAPVPGTATNPTPSVPAPPCEAGYLLVWAVSPDDIANPRAISFNGLMGNAVLRQAGGSAGAYRAVAIQSIQPTCAAGTGGPGQPACAPTILDPTDPGRPLVLDGLTEYALVPGKVVATVRLDRDFAAGGTFRVDSVLTLMTLDVNSNRPNLPVFVDLDFFNEVETARSTATEFVCWTEKSLSRPDVAVQSATLPACGPAGPCIDRNLREGRFPGRKVLLESGAAVKQQFFGVQDPACPPTASFPGFPTGTCPATLLGLVETRERRSSGANAPYVREYSSTMLSSGPGVPTTFVPR
jgi:hypothetical protein